MNVTATLAERVRDRLALEGIIVSAWGNGPGDRYAPHAHDYDKVLVAVEGSIVFRLPALGASHELATGDRLDLPAGTLHAAEVGPDGVRCLEGHLPPGVLSPEVRRMAHWATGAPGRPAIETESGDRT
jgi:quercetin dioxygenase-like cupin family protein